MISLIYTNIISRPLYNGLILLMKALPFFDAGVIVIIFTIIVKLLMLPLSIKASKAQLEMKNIQKDLDEIKLKYKDKEEQAKKTIEYYKEHGINPFASFFILLIQLPIIIGLYRIFLKSGLPQISHTLLYWATLQVMIPNSMVFLHIINISQKSLLLAIIAGISTYFQISLASGSQIQESNTKGSQADFAKAMNMNMKYFFPVLVGFISYSISAALCLYWITSNLFAIGQEIYIRKRYHKAPPLVV